MKFNESISLLFFLLDLYKKRKRNICATIRTKRSVVSRLTCGWNITFLYLLLLQIYTDNSLLILIVSIRIAKRKIVRFKIETFTKGYSTKLRMEDIVVITEYDVLSLNLHGFDWNKEKDTYIDTHREIHEQKRKIKFAWGRRRMLNTYRASSIVI